MRWPSGWVTGSRRPVGSTHLPFWFQSSPISLPFFSQFLFHSLLLTSSQRILAIKNSIFWGIYSVRPRTTSRRYRNSTRIQVQAPLKLGFQPWKRNPSQRILQVRPTADIINYQQNLPSLEKLGSKVPANMDAKSAAQAGFLKTCWLLLGISEQSRGPYYVRIICEGQAFILFECLRLGVFLLCNSRTQIWQSVIVAVTHVHLGTVRQFILTN